MISNNCNNFILKIWTLYITSCVTPMIGCTVLSRRLSHKGNCYQCYDSSHRSSFSFCCLRNDCNNFSGDGSSPPKMDSTLHHVHSAWCDVHCPFFGVELHTLLIISFLRQFAGEAFTVIWSMISLHCDLETD